MLLTAVDDRYLDEAAFLIRSCARHMPQQRFYLHLINSSERRVAPMRAVHPRLIVEHVERPYVPEQWRSLMCCARTVPLLHVLREYREPTVYLDSDILVVRPLDELFALLETCDLSVRLRPQVVVAGAGGTLDAGKFNSGVIAVRPSAVGLEFAAEYDRRVRAWIEAGRPAGYVDPQCGVFTAVDQEFLYLVYEEFKRRLAFVPLPNAFNDSRLRPSSALWHGKGIARHHPRYVLEKLSYTRGWRRWVDGALAWPRYAGRLALRAARGQGTRKA